MVVYGFKPMTLSTNCLGGPQSNQFPVIKAKLIDTKKGNVGKSKKGSKNHASKVSNGVPMNNELPKLK